MSPKSNLLKAFNAASGSVHKRDFEVAGYDLVFPRLDLRNQAIFERAVRASAKDIDDPTQRAEVARFSLSLTRNRASMSMSGCVEQVVKDLRADGLPDGEFESEAEARLWEAQLQTGILKRWEPYAETIFSPFQRDNMAYAVMLSLQQENGTEIKGDEGAEPIEVDQKFVESLFGDSQELLDKVFLWVVGLANVPEEGEVVEEVKSASDLVDKYVGTDSGNAETSQTNSES